MNNMVDLLARWHLDTAAVREKVYRSATPRERERWHALWLMTRGMTAAEVAEALDRDPHTVGGWLEAFRQSGPEGLVFEQGGGSPPPLGRKSRRS